MQSVIDRFFERYGIERSEADFALLQKIAACFAFLPYENVTKILKDAVSIRIDSKLRSAEEVLDDHLRWGTGGTCFSLCNVLRVVLAEAGFDARIAMADMHYGTDIHCAVIVELDHRYYLLDPGYLLHEPMPLPEAGLELVKHTVMNRVVLIAESETRFSIFTEENGEKKWRYRLKLEEVSPDEFRKHWVHSFSLNTMDQIMLSRVSPSGRLYFRKDRLDTVNPASRLKTSIAQDEVPALSKLFGLPADLIGKAQRALLSRPIV